MHARILMSLALLVALVGLTVPSYAADRSACQIATHHTHRCKTVRGFGHRAIEGKSEGTIWALRTDARHHVQWEAPTWRLAAPDGTPDAGPPVVIHNPTIGLRVDPHSMPPGITGDTKIGSITPAQWAALRTFPTALHPHGLRLPTLQHFLTVAQRLRDPGLVQIKWSLPSQAWGWAGPRVRWYGAPADVGGRCYQNAVLDGLGYGVKVGLKVNPACPVSLAQAQADGYSFVVGPVPSAAYVRQAHADHLWVCNYDSGDPSVWAELIDRGADAIIAPNPNRLRRWLGQ